MEFTHDAPVVFHPGFLKTYQKIRERFTWKGLKDDVLMYVRECSACQQNKVEHIHPIGLFQPLPIIEKNGKVSPWNSLQGFLRSKGKIYYMSCLIN